MFKTIIFFLFATLSLANLVHANEDIHDHEFEEHASHVHGHAIAHISFDHAVLNIELSLSSIDVFGFEHRPKNDAQREKIAQSIATLEKSDNLFIFKINNTCEIDSVNVSSEIIGSDAEEHDHSDSSQEVTHSDVTANYVFKCPEKDLESIEYLLFDHFPTLDKIEAQFVSEDHQDLFYVTPDNRIQNLK